MTSVVSPTFANYDLSSMPPNGVYGLSDGLLVEMARAFGVKTDKYPTEQQLRNLIDKIGLATFLQDNIAVVRELLRTQGDATAIAADWVKRSGCLEPLNRSFVRPDLPVPEQVDVAVVAGGVARWMLRRQDELIRRIAAGARAKRVILAGGARVMKPGEHPLVGTYMSMKGKPLLEHEFLEEFVEPLLKAVGLDASTVPVGSESGSQVMHDVAQAIGSFSPGFTVLAVGNAPSAVKTAGNLRRACRGVDRGFDRNGDALFVACDTIEVAEQGEGPETHQNPLSALGQLARNGLALDREQRTLIR